MAFNLFGPFNRIEYISLQFLITFIITEGAFQKITSSSYGEKKINTVWRLICYLDAPYICCAKSRFCFSFTHIKEAQPYSTHSAICLHISHLYFVYDFLWGEGEGLFLLAKNRTAESRHLSTKQLHVFMNWLTSNIKRKKKNI